MRCSNITPHSLLCTTVFLCMSRAQSWRASHTVVSRQSGLHQLLSSLTSFPTTATTQDISTATLKCDKFALVSGVGGPVFMPSDRIVGGCDVRKEDCGPYRRINTHSAISDLPYLPRIPRGGSCFFSSSFCGERAAAAIYNHNFVLPCAFVYVCRCAEDMCGALAGCQDVLQCVSGGLRC